MILADAHCHLGSRQFDNNREEVLSSMLENGVEKAILICCSEHDRLASISLRDKFPGFKLALGIHPQDLE
ncbi:MAG: TatD family hydrolase, partial [Oscillospiraceae bacterium]|nr:TatD family hydrolase [Oscillospiraceae bacterium]